MVTLALIIHLRESGESAEQPGEAPLDLGAAKPDEGAVARVALNDQAGFAQRAPVVGLGRLRHRHREGRAGTLGVDRSRDGVSFADGVASATTRAADGPLDLVGGTACPGRDQCHLARRDLASAARPAGRPECSG